MIGLDTPVLIALLRGDPAVRPLLTTWSGQELAATEWSMIELEAVARRTPGPGRERRLAAIRHLRRAITVLPIDERTTRALSARLAETGLSSRELVGLANLSAVEAAGGSEWWTQQGFLGRRRPRSKLQIKELKLSASL